MQALIPVFEHAVLPHLDAAYNLARWLTRDQHDAEDVLQEALLRAFTFFEGFRGADARAWVLKIVRNTCFTWIKANRPSELVVMDTVNERLVPKTAAEELQHALAGLPQALREVLVLREMEGLSYKEIAAIIEAPIGTVMSRIARGRADLRYALRNSRCEGR